MKRHARLNRIFRLVWSQTLNLWVFVADTVRGHGRGSAGYSGVDFASAAETSGGGSSPAHEPECAGLACGRLRRAFGGLIGLLGVWAMLAGPVRAGPPAGQVVAENGSTAHSASAITQAGVHVAADWKTFSTAASESVTVIQPDVQVNMLNPITGIRPSSLLGTLSGNGRMFILNPNGVLFDAATHGNVGGPAASTPGLRNTDVIASRTTFSSDVGSSIGRLNQDAATAAPDRDVVMLAREVRDEGVTGARRGAARMAAGAQVLLALNNGPLLRYNIDRRALNALTDNRPLIQVDGGQVILSTQALNALSRASVNNDGATGALTLEQLTERIRLLADMAVGTVNVSAALDTSAPTAGDGGLIETSVASSKNAGTAVIPPLVPMGETGTWLVDPHDLWIGRQASANDLTGVAAGAARERTNVVYNSGDGATGSNGDLLVNQSVIWTANHSPALNALHSVYLLGNGSLHASGTMGSVVLNAGTETTGARFTTRAPAQ